MAKVCSAGLTVSGVTYGESVLAGDLVGWSSGKLVRACPLSGEEVPAVGVAAAAYEPDDVGAMHLMCEISGVALTGQAAGDVIYLSTSAPGYVQKTVPVGAGNLKQAVGYAVAADRVAIVLQDAGVTL